MIQRIQTIYFVIALLLVSLPLFGLRFFNYTLNSTNYVVSLFGIENDLKPTIDSRNYYLPIILISVLLIAVIFNYKNRKRQIYWAWFALLLNLSTAAWILMDVISGIIECKNCISTSPVPQVGFYLFASAFIFILLGIFGVQRDKKLVDSLNRIR